MQLKRAPKKNSIGRYHTSVGMLFTAVPREYALLSWPALSLYEDESLCSVLARDTQRTQLTPMRIGIGTHWDGG